MKILAIGDFHGKFPQKFENVAKKENINLILSTGDYRAFLNGAPCLKKCSKQEKWEKRHLARILSAKKIIKNC